MAPVAVYSNIGHTITHMVTILYATAVLHLPSIFGLPYGEMLGLSSAGLVLYGVAALPAGWLGDRWSQVGMMIVFFFGVGLGAIVTGLASTKTDLFIGLSLLGLFASIYHPVGIAWLVASARKQGMTLGINGVFGGLGGALAPAFVGLMIDHLSWREAFWIPGALSIALGVALLISWRRGAVQDVYADRVAAVRPSSAAIKRVFIVLTLTMACNGFVYAGLTHTMPKLFAGGLGTELASSYTEIGLYVSAVIGFASLSSLLGGWLADRFSPRLVYIVLWSVLTLPLFFVTSTFGFGLVSMVTTVLIVNTGFAAAENMLVAQYTPFEWRALAYGAKFVLALGVGGVTVHLAGSAFDSSGNFNTLYASFGVAAAFATVCALLLPAQSKHVPASSEA
jgi:MFS transporter, FSR family, fosmidomycin resistance protein